MAHGENVQHEGEPSPRQHTSVAPTTSAEAPLEAANDTASMLEIVGYQLRLLTRMQSYQRLARFFIPAIVPLGLVVFFRVSQDVDIGNMTRDVAALGDIHPLFGFLSVLGILLWWSSASIWAFAGWLQHGAGLRRGARFAFASAALSAYLALDDQFQVHEMLAPTYLLLPEDAVQVGLLVAFALYLFGFRHALLRPDAALLIIACALLAVAMAADHLPDAVIDSLHDWAFLLEDGAKWLGIVCWLGFCLTRCGAEVRRASGRQQVLPSDPREGDGRVIVRAA